MPGDNTDCNGYFSYFDSLFLRARHPDLWGFNSLTWNLVAILVNLRDG
jgi:hypothetical protein